MTHRDIEKFQHIVRKSKNFTDERSQPIGGLHPFDERNIHAKIDLVSRSLFDDGHYAQATFEAYKYIDNLIKSESGLNESGYKLMMNSFNENNPKIKLNSLSSTTERDEQQGYKFIFVGTVLAIRNPRGHECDIVDTIDECLDHLGLASLLMRRLEQKH